MENINSGINTEDFRAVLLHDIEELLSATNQNDVESASEILIANVKDFVELRTEILEFNELLHSLTRPREDAVFSED